MTWTMHGLSNLSLQKIIVFFEMKWRSTIESLEIFFEVFYFEISFINTEENVTTQLLSIFIFAVP